MNVAGKGDTDPLSTSIKPFGGGVGNGSTDVGDVSWIVPTAGLNVATAASDTPGHSWGMTACAGSGIGTRGAQTAAKVLALSTIDLLVNEKLREEAIRDFNGRKGDMKYEPVLDPAPPPERLDDF
jgi:aminobenzoyl-glutamate utilization protein B